MSGSLPQSSVDDDDVGLVPAPGAVLAGKYRVESVVGAGGMGVVVAAQHLTLGQTVAVKLLRVAGLDDARRTEACARFLREGQAAARLTSEHVVRIHDVGTLDDGAPFMVMELLRGSDVSTILEQRGMLSVDLAVEYLLQVCDAVGEAHQLGIVHRDLKPSNLFVSTRSDGRPLVKVLDFGISKALASADDPLQGNLTATRSVVGSPYYMSPEQVRDAKRVDPRSDIWSLGMILYELLVGEPAFNADTLPGICAAIAADTPPPIRDRRADVPPELETIVMRCLEKDPGRRFQNVVELVRALAPFLTMTGRASTADYASKRLEQNRKAVAERRVNPDSPTVYSSPDSGMRLSDKNGPAPSGDPVSAASTGLPAVLRADSRVEPVVVRDATLVSRTGTSMPAKDAATLAPQREPEVLATVAPKTERDAPRRALWIAAAVVFVGGGVAFYVRQTPPAAPPEPPPLLHEPVGPAPPPPSLTAGMPAVPVAPNVPEAPAPSAAAAGSSAGASAKPTRPVAKAHGVTRVAPPTPPAQKTPSGSTAPADIRLER